MTDESPLLPPHGRPPLADRMPCSWCRAPTLVATLNQYGARCFECYEAYCQAPQPSPNVGDKRTGDPRAWAHALRAREERGDRLTLAQRDMRRAARVLIQ